MIQLSGLQEGRDIDIKYIGLRKGEKLNEELYWQGEDIVSTENEKIRMLRQNGLDKENVLTFLRAFEKNEQQMKNNNPLDLLKILIPEGTFGCNGRNGSNNNGFKKTSQT